MAAAPSIQRGHAALERPAAVPWPEQCWVGDNEQECVPCRPAHMQGGELRAVLGASGGPRIISAVLQTLVRWAGGAADFALHTVLDAAACAWPCCCACRRPTTDLLIRARAVRQCIV